MARTKTKATGASVDDYIASRANEQQHADCRALMALLGKLTRQPPYMWGPSIVGYGSYRYAYESGHSGEAPIAGFAIRGRDLVVYLLESEVVAAQAWQAQDGKVLPLLQDSGRPGCVCSRATHHELNGRSKAPVWPVIGAGGR